MGKISFENFGKRAEKMDNYLEISGRYTIHQEAESYIVPDINKKLDLKPFDTVLDIGCGAGNLLIPLSFSVKEITGIDHPSILKKLKSRFTDLTNISLIPGNFLDVSVQETFDKIICYSVLHYLSDKREVFLFIDKALELISSGGKVLFGDLQNISKKERFLRSDFGINFVLEWNEIVNKASKDSQSIDFEEDQSLVEIDDDLVLEILKKVRMKGYNSYLLAQPLNLPLCHTREDILIVKP